jgi:large subunit ribosomal protein L7e
VLKKQARTKKFNDAAVKSREERKVKNLARRTEWTEKAIKYEAEYLAVEKNEIKKNRDARKVGNDTFYVPAQPKVFLVTRIRGTRKLHPDVQKIFRLLRMRQIHNTVFVRVNKATSNMIRRIEPYVTYGFPTVATIRRLIYKRGYVKVNGRRTAITDNRIIEKALGRVGITCIEDLIHEIVTCGPNFKAANNFIWPFKLNNPRGGYRNKRHPYITKGDWGLREWAMNDFIKQVL